MTIPDAHDALMPVRVAADLCGIPTRRVLAMLSNKMVRAVRIQGREFVSLAEVEKAIGEGRDDLSL